MSEREMRVPMPRRGASFINDDEVAVHLPPQVGRRFSMDVDEELLARMGKEAIGYIVERLAHEVVSRNAESIRHTVESYVLDRSWAEPVIRDAIRESVHRIIADMLELESPTGRKEAR